MVENIVDFEITRNKKVTEPLFLSGLGEIGFEVIKNYDALPRNYRVRDSLGRSREDSLAVLVDFPYCEQDPQAGDGLVELAGFAPSKLGTPVNQIDDYPRVSPQGEGRYVWEDTWGAHWGVIRQCRDDLSLSPVQGIAPGDYETEVKLNANGVDYYILDTGVDPDHPEFNEFEYGYRTIAAANGDLYYEVGEDDSDHGTGAASCGAGRTMGVARNSRVIWAKGLDALDTGSSSSLIAGLDALVAEFTARAAEGRPGVVNNSWYASSSTAYTVAVDAAIDAGLVMVASAGNSGQDLAGISVFPAEYDDVLSVSTMDIDGRPCDFANYGVNVDAWSAGRDVIQGWRGGTLGWGSGTSTACGFTSGIICCLLQGYARPQGRADVLAVYDHVRAIAQDLIRAVGDSRYDGSTREVFRLPNQEQWEIARIPGLRNMIAQKRHMIGGSCFQRQVTTSLAVGPAKTAPIHPRRSTHEHEIYYGQKNPATALAEMESFYPWLHQNHGFIDSSTESYLCGSAQLGDLDGRSEPLLIPGRETEVPFIAFFGIPLYPSTEDRHYLTVPLDMTLESGAVHLFDIFTNLDFQTGDTTGWTGTGVTGIANTATDFKALVGVYFYRGAGGADNSISQIAALPASFDTGKIDSGKIKLYFECAIGSDWVSDPNDAARVRVFAVDGADVDISTIFDTGIQYAAVAGLPTWDTPGPFIGAGIVLPTGTRKLRILVEGLFFAGTLTNAVVDGLSGWVYEEISSGQKILDHVRRGEAELEFSHIGRTYNIDSDDQGRVEFQFISASNILGGVETDGFVSPYAWTHQLMRRRIPDDSIAVRCALRGKLKAGSIIGYYYADPTIKVRLGRGARPIASKQRQFTIPSKLQVTSTVYETKTISTISP